MKPYDTLVGRFGADDFWCGPFEDTIVELGIRAAVFEIEENDGGNRADLMLEEWAQRGCPRFTSPYTLR